MLTILPDLNIYHPDDIIGRMAIGIGGIERPASLAEDYDKCKAAISKLAEQPFVKLDCLKMGWTDIIDLTSFAAKSYLFNITFRKMVRQDTSLPNIVRRDPPSLRSTIWMIMVDEALVDDPKVKIPRPLEKYPWRLYALTRCYFNGLDDVMDSTHPLLSNWQALANPNFRQITQALAKEFHHIHQQTSEATASNVRTSLRSYRLARDLWIDHYNFYEGDRDNLTFDEYVKYIVNTMGPLTEILFYTLAVNHHPSPQLQERVRTGLIWYGTAGKIMDDMTDWLKDFKKGEPNIFTLALQESGEIHRVAELSRLFNLVGRRAVIPISLFNALAPQATSRTFGVVDFYLNKLDDCNLARFSSTLKGARQMLWAYALNEGVPQI